MFITGIPSNQRYHTRVGRPTDAEPVQRFGDLRAGDVAHWLRVEGMGRELYDAAVLHQVARPMPLGFKTDEIQRMIAIGEAGAL
jgi:hypothetical protein